MTYTYYADVRCLDNETLFREKVKLLSPYRQQKIAILRHEKDKKRSLAAGLLLDHALAAFGLQERSVEYEIGEWGKPALKYHPEICFSLSHSGDYAICTVGDKPVGNDIGRNVFNPFSMAFILPFVILFTISGLSLFGINKLIEFYNSNFKNKDTPLEKS